MDAKTAANALLKKYSLSEEHSYYVRSMLLAGADESTVVRAIKLRASLDKGKVMSLACPKCNGTMVPTSLLSERRALFCPNDRVCLPMPYAKGGN